MIASRCFKDEIEYRREEAERTILCRTIRKTRNDHVVGYFERFGQISKCFALSSDQEHKKLLVEFSRKSDAADFLRNCAASNPSTIGRPFANECNRFVHVEPVMGEKVLSRQCPQCEPEQNASQGLAFLSSLPPNSSIDDQIMTLYTRTRLSDLATRLRFLTALQIEETTQRLFPSLVALPFGSSVNGFGRMGSDIDVTLTDKEDTKVNPSPANFIWKSSKISPNQQILGTLSLILRTWMPGVSKAAFIDGAMIPIIKYEQTLTGLEVDISLSNP